MAARSLLESENFIKKVYLPKLIFPMSKVCLRMVDFLFALTALILLGALMGFPIHDTYFFLPLAILPLFIFTAGIGVIVSVLTVYFRDVEYLLGVLLQVLYFATPILYPARVLPERYQPFLNLNPVYTQIKLFHELIYYGRLPTETLWLNAWAVALLFLVGGLTLLFSLEDDLVFRM